MRWTVLGTRSSPWPHGITWHVAGPLSLVFPWFGGMGKLTLGDNIIDVSGHPCWGVGRHQRGFHPEMLLRLYSSANSIKGKLGDPLAAWVVVPFSMRDWRVCLFLPLNIILSCFQLVCQSSASLASILRASR